MLIAPHWTVRRCALLGLVATVMPFPALAGDAAVHVTFGHVLSDFTGPLPYGEARVAVDRASGEVLVGWGRDVRVFNAVGMQVHKFSTSLANAGILDLVVTPSGDLLTGALDLDSPGDHPRVVIDRHDFRGVPLLPVTVSGLPEPLAGLLPNRFFHHDGTLILVDTARWQAVFVERDGGYAGGVDLFSAVGLGDADRDALQITGITVDSKGNFLLTCAVMFRAFVVSQEGALLASWGKPGSVPGTFGVVSGIASDGRGRTFVADKSRGVVMVFDPAHRFVTEFGGDPSSAGVLGLPVDVVADDAGHLYVTQIGRPGVWVYDVRPE